MYIFCSVLVMLIFHATPWPFERIPSNYNYVKLFPGKDSYFHERHQLHNVPSAMSMPHMTWLSHNVKSQLREFLTEFFFIAVLRGRIPETPQTILIPRFELPLSILGKNY